MHRSHQLVRRNVIEASRPIPLRQMLTIAARFVAALTVEELDALARSVRPGSDNGTAA
jgi:hypothetical protein